MNTTLTMKSISLLFIIAIAPCADAQTPAKPPATDSAEIRQMIADYEEWLMKEEMRLPTDGIQPIFRGSTMVFTERTFNNLPGKYRHYKQDIRDYSTAILPLSTSWLLKAIGMKSRSTTKRMLLSNTFAVIISSGVVKGTKLIAKEDRPDEHGNESFPSGHSSLAYVGATILHREFGHHSPWISIGGYATATASQILRIKHNRHWAHDTFVGAGIGVVSTNFAYFLTDKILGEEGINRPSLTYKDIMRVYKYNAQPSSITFFSGSEFGNRTICQDDIHMHETYQGASKIRVGAGYTAGVEGTLFLNQNFAIEATAKLTTSKAKAVLTPTNNTEAPLLYGTHLDFYRLNIGVRYSHPFTMVNRISTGIHIGTRTMPTMRFDNYATGKPFISIPGETKFDCGALLSYDWITSKKYAFGLSFSYHYTLSDIMPHRYGMSTVWRILL